MDYKASHNFTVFLMCNFLSRNSLIVFRGQLLIFLRRLYHNGRLAFNYYLGSMWINTCPIIGNIGADSLILSLNGETGQCPSFYSNTFRYPRPCRSTCYFVPAFLKNIFQFFLNIPSTFKEDFANFSAQWSSSYRCSHYLPSAGLKMRLSAL